MKKLLWQKIPFNNIVNKENLWTRVGKLFQHCTVDYPRMEQLFALPGEGAGDKRPGGGGAEGGGGGTPDVKRKKENTEINLLDGKRSLNVNIFLKQFRMSHQDIVRLLQDGHSQQFGAERLKGLLKQLPSQEEIDLLKNFDGDREKLGNAEKFFHCLMALPNFRMRIEGLLIKEDFNSNMDWIRPSIEAIIQAAKDIKENKSLQEIIFLILITGNYLNSGNHAGNAAGFKLSSLLKLTEIRANKPGMNLLHYVLLEVEEKNPRLFRFPEEMGFLKDAAQVSMESLTSDVKGLTGKVKAITEQIGLAGHDFQQQMAHFLKEANVEVLELEEDLKDIDDLRKDLAVFFSETPESFKLDDCFKTLQTFCDRFSKGIQENKQRKVKEEKEEQRRRQKAAANKKNSKEPNEPGDQSMSRDEEGGSIVDMLLADVRSGFCNRQYGEGNFNVTKVRKVQLDTSALAAALTSGTGDVVSPSSLDGKDLVRRGFGRVSMHKKKAENGDTTTDQSSADTSSDSLGSDSLTRTRSRKSYATEDDASLIEFLMDSSLDADTAKPEAAFDRYASLRRRRQERRERRKVLDVVTANRERAPSPAVSADGASCPTTPITNGLPEAADGTSSESNGHTRRRTRSWLDRPSVEKTLAERKRNGTSSEEETDALVARIKTRLHGKSTDKEEQASTAAPSPAQRAASPFPFSPHGPDTCADNSRWRKSVETAHHHLEALSEKDSDPARTDTNLQGVRTVPKEEAPRVDLPAEAEPVTRRQTTLEKSRQRMKQRYSSVDGVQLSKLLDGDTWDKTPASKDDSDMQVARSMRLLMSTKMGTNVDGLLKTIEESDRPIDNFGVIIPSVRQQQTEIVTAMVTADKPAEGSGGESAALKQKREMRKMRSSLVLNDVHSALQGVSGNGHDNTTPKQAAGSSKNSHHGPRPSHHSTSHSKPTNGEQSKEEKRQAAKKNFREARFGYKSAPQSKGRTHSDVGQQAVDQALKDLVSKDSSITRSKSYDEAVARQASSEGKRTIRNSGSNPDTSYEKKSLRRGHSANRLDGRRNGEYLPSDESDTELRPEDTARVRSAWGKANKSTSRTSIKSANTSTETLQLERDSEDESGSEAGSQPSPQSPSIRRGVMGEVSARRYSHQDSNDLERAVTRLQSKVEQLEDDDSPMASVAKWSLKRTMRLSVADSPDHLHEAGSRVSYACSCASSTDTDQGFDSMSSVSQHTSISSTLESDSAPTSLRVGHRDSGISDSTASETSFPGDDTLRVTMTEDGTTPSLPTLSPDSGHGSWSSASTPTRPAPSSTKAGGTNGGKPEASVPSYMRATNRSSRTRGSPASEAETRFKRDDASRKSFRAKDSPLKKDSAVRASMRAEKALKRDSPADGALKRDVTSRMSVRAARSSAQSPPTVSSPSAVRSAAPQSTPARGGRKVGVAGRPEQGSDTAAKTSSAQRLTVGSRESSRPTTPSSRPTTPSARATPTPTPPARAYRTTSASAGLTRSQSMRVTPSRSSLGNPRAAADPSRRSATPVSHDKSGAAAAGQDAKRSATPAADYARRRSRLTEGPATSTPSSKSAATPSPSSSKTPDTSLTSPTPDSPSNAASPKAPPRSRSRLHEPTKSSASKTQKDSGAGATTSPRSLGSGKEVGLANSLTRHGSLRQGKTTTTTLTSKELPKGNGAGGKSGGLLNKRTGSKKVAPADEHLPTVAEGKDPEEAKAVKKVGKGKDKPTTSPNKKVVVSSTQARASSKK